MRKHLAAALLFIAVFNSYSQPLQKPKLVIGIVVDQMRWDFLFRYNSRYVENGGFKRLMNKGFNCNNTLISNTPTYTACGQTAIYTGAIQTIKKHQKQLI